MVGIDRYIRRKNWEHFILRAGTIGVLVEPVEVEVEPDSPRLGILALDSPKTVSAPVGFALVLASFVSALTTAAGAAGTLASSAKLTAVRSDRTMEVVGRIRSLIISI